ncbi:MAG TPA: organoarsenical effux MFS transporter ArsJ [Candidatus Binataceae bacterium]|nr:organoarsenical effux MFS transporter ArsJ [Candidatus Binataceae bacterium]
MNNALRNYALVTGAYWGFTLTDGALRMLVLLHFDRLGYSAVEIAFLFLFYEFFGIVTNLLGGWIAARAGLKVTLYGGLLLQIGSLIMLALLQPAWSRLMSVCYVMSAQALSGIAKDLTKMSAKTAIKVVVPEGAEGALFKWVARLTGSKNALKGAGYFMGGALLGALGFTGSLIAMAVGLLAVLLATVFALPRGMGKAKTKIKFSHLFSKSSAVNWLSAARLFLFASRDVWFVVGLPVFLYSVLHWSFWQVGAFASAWFIGYGFVQALVPEILRLVGAREGVTGDTARLWAFVLVEIPICLALALGLNVSPGPALMIGLAVFMVVFAINSSVHSYLILAYSGEDEVAVNVGFYYMANAGGRLLGTLLSGLIFEFYGFIGCLLASGIMVLAASLLSFNLPRAQGVQLTVKLKEADA